MLKYVSKSTCDDCLLYFVDLVASVKQNINNTSNGPDTCWSSVFSVVFNVFERVSPF